jgi:hypothetical protein
MYNNYDGKNAIQTFASIGLIVIGILFLFGTAILHTVMNFVGLVGNFVPLLVILYVVNGVSIIFGAAWIAEIIDNGNLNFNFSDIFKKD